MGNLIKTEWYKLKKDRSFRFLTLMLLALSVLFPLIEFDNGGPNLPLVKDYYLESILATHNNIVKLIPSILAGFYISAEYAMGTMKSIASSGNNRIKIYFAKLIVFSIGTVIISLILPIFMTGTSAIYFGFEELPAWSFYFGTIGLIVLYGAAFASIMAFFSIIFTDSGKTIGFLLMFFIFIDWPLQVLAAKVPIFEPVVNHSVFKLIYDISIVSSLGGSELFKLVLVPIVTFFVFGILGSFIYLRKEIK
ncbi:ABC transporter permease [Jeotgalibacillus salarius]|uniref:ABC transporter permease n=1 Tax=Jeotgalibacillus salarius TaxID=546023 RepID=A0A4Y8LGH1_9BACL|nr:ABC transporter permease [Jeotgalibacillus salarius]TFE00687.1 ABC transporter permease [Jeotgalibacillus salarius]